MGNEKLKPAFFQPAELVKMSNLVADAMAKLSIVAEKLFSSKDAKNVILLLQAWDNLRHVYSKLNKAGRTETKRYGRKTLEKLEGALEKIGG